jgi:PTH1 family peptidyl-tRNA hydrolase
VRLFRRGSDPDRAGDRWVVVGLGNPGSRYEGTRHNIGAMALEVMRERAGVSLSRHKSGTFVAETSIEGERVVLARPISFMNESGRPVRALMDWYKISPDRLIVLHDEIDIPFADVRIKWGGGTAGHNGLGSIVSHIGTKDFTRIRIGVGRPRGRRGAADHVLKDFSTAERKELPLLLERAADAATRVIADGPDKAMNEVNTRDTPT